MRLDAAIQNAALRLSESSDSARLDAELLLCRTIDMPRSYVIAHPDDELDTLSLQRFEKLLARRIDGEPMAYIAGSQEFWSQDLFVSPATLIPRPETELVVELALREIPKRTTTRILDLGTGSGAIAIALAIERPLCDISAVDISADAIAVADENARHLGVANVEFLVGSWTSPVSSAQFDLIVSNPPYVRSDDKALERLRHEPLSALASGKDGLDDIRVLASDCGAILSQGGSLILEHGALQRMAVATILRQRGWKKIACHNDLAGNPRVTVARRNDT